MVNDTSMTLVFRALESPVRRRILQGIAEKRQPIKDLAKPLKISLPAVSKHLKILEQADLIRRTKVQRFYYFEVNLEPLDDAEEWIRTYAKFWKGNLASLKKYINSHPTS